MFLSIYLDTFIVIFLRYFIYLFLERGEGKEKERNMCGCLLCAPYWGPDLAHNPSMCPDCVSNQRPFYFQAIAQSTEPHHPRAILIMLWQ